MILATAWGSDSRPAILTRVMAQDLVKRDYAANEVGGNEIVAAFSLVDEGRILMSKGVWGNQGGLKVFALDICSGNADGPPAYCTGQGDYYDYHGPLSGPNDICLGLYFDWRQGVLAPHIQVMAFIDPASFGVGPPSFGVNAAGLGATNGRAAH